MWLRTFNILILIQISRCLPSSAKKETKNYNYTAILDIIYSRINETIDPCDDFYEFSCGGYLSDQIIANDSDYTGVLGEIGENTKYQLNEVLNKTITDTDIIPFKVAKIFYQKCMDEGL